jgi:hypothetical protein
MTRAAHLAVEPIETDISNGDTAGYSQHFNLERNRLLTASDTGFPKVNHGNLNRQSSGWSQRHTRLIPA